MILRIEAIDEKTGSRVRSMDLVGPEIIETTVMKGDAIVDVLRNFVQRAQVSLGRLDSVMAASRINAEKGEGRK